MLFSTPSHTVPAVAAQIRYPAGHGPGCGTITVRMVEPIDQRHLHRAGALRCAVFCKEKNWFRPQQVAGQWIEQDSFDVDARHFVAVQHLPGRYDQVVATVRLVRYSELMGLPTGRVNQGLYAQLGQRGIALETVAEVSRLCLAPQFRNHPMLLPALLRELYYYSKQAGIVHWVASMEDSLCRLLRSNAIALEPLDTRHFDYFGAVRAFLLAVEQTEACMQQREPLFHYFAAAPYTGNRKGDHHVPAL